MSKPQRLANGTFMINSTVPLVPVDSDVGRNFSCRVRHTSLPEPLEEDVRLLIAEELQRGGISVTALVVSLLVILVIGAVLAWFLYRRLTRKKLELCEIQGLKTWILGETVELVCVGHHCPKGTEITWLKLHRGNETEIEASAVSEHQDMEPLLEMGGYRVKTSRSAEGRGLFTITSTLLITPSVEEDEGAAFKCSFHTKNQEINEEKEFKAFIIQGKPQVVADITCSPCDGRKVLCSLELQRFYPKNIQINWSCGAQELQDIISEEHETENSDHQTFNIRTECKIPESDFTDPNFRIRVTWEHAPPGEPQCREMSVTDPGFPGRPVQDDIAVPRLISGVEAALQCRVWKYLLNELQVEWLKVEKGRDEPLPLPDGESGYQLEHTEPSYAPGDGYSCTASLTFTPLLSRDQASEFICRVSHPTLQGPLERSTGELTVLAAPTLGEMKIAPSGDGLVLTLDVTGFYPQTITISWSSDLPGKLSNLPSTLNIPESSGGTYSVRSTCELSEHMIRKIGGADIMAHVVHESRSDPLRVTKQIGMNGTEWCLFDPTPA